jgi:hypothetical protein
MATATGGRRNPLTYKVLATADDLDGTVDGTQYLDLTGAGGCVIIAQNNGTAGTAGIDVIEFSKDGGTSWAAATASNLKNRHLGLLNNAGAAVTGAALNAAGTEVDAVFFLGPTKGPFMIRVARGGSGAGGTAWTTGAPSVVGIRIG